MNTVNIFLGKYVIYAIYGIMLIGLLSAVRGCSANNDRNRMQKEIVNLQVQVDSLKSKVPSQKDVEKAIRIEGLKTSKRTLIDMNTIVLTRVRPDQQIKDYDILIDLLEKEIDNNNVEVD